MQELEKAGAGWQPRSKARLFLARIPSARSIFLIDSTPAKLSLWGKRPQRSPGILTKASAGIVCTRVLSNPTAVRHSFSVSSQLAIRLSRNIRVCPFFRARAMKRKPETHSHAFGTFAKYTYMIIVEVVHPSGHPETSYRRSRDRAESSGSCRLETYAQSFEVEQSHVACHTRTNSLTGVHALFQDPSTHRDKKTGRLRDALLSSR